MKPLIRASCFSDYPNVGAPAPAQYSRAHPARMLASSDQFRSRGASISARERSSGCAGVILSPAGALGSLVAPPPEWFFDAKRLEHRTLNQLVHGSSPCRGTTSFFGNIKINSVPDVAAISLRTRFGGVRVRCRRDCFFESVRDDSLNSKFRSRLEVSSHEKKFRSISVQQSVFRFGSQKTVDTRACEF